MSVEDLGNATTGFDPTLTHDDFLNQLLSGLQTTVSWPQISPPHVDHFTDHSTFLSSKLRQHHITVSSPFFQHDDVSSFKSPIVDNNTSIQNLFQGLTGSLTSNQPQQFRNLPTQNFGSSVAATPVMNTASATVGGGGAASQPRQRVRARRGQATDPHSIAERLRRERIAERMKALQELVPNANKTDKASMLDDIIDYVKFLQLQVKVLSMSRLGGGAGSNVGVQGGGGGECGQQSGVGPLSSSNNDTTTVAENQVVKLMEEDMGSAMQYLQGKGLCLMPISLATAISANRGHRGGGDGGGPSSPNVSVMTVQSGNGAHVKDSP
ncbi:hypothetical protein QVD17_22926 [Tagetes erecta]|uniref:BHLH domain-containing protein n=1 Tax=Tagetes erecta TaxID=13708 RepID=A0AAD8KDH3_TARER|nr:hypothetical protein QVD17_22926 [Tagetes erecta]